MLNFSSIVSHIVLIDKIYISITFDCLTLEIIPSTEGGI